MPRLRSYLSQTCLSYASLSHPSASAEAILAQRLNTKGSLGRRPEPGHAYFCEETLALLQTMYPEMDLEPYRAALGDGAPRL